MIRIKDFTIWGQEKIFTFLGTRMEIMSLSLLKNLNTEDCYWGHHSGHRL